MSLRNPEKEKSCMNYLVSGWVEHCIEEVFVFLLPAIVARIFNYDNVNDGRSPNVNYS